MDGQLLDVSTGFEDEGYFIPMLILFCADDIDSNLIDPQGDVLPFNFRTYVSAAFCRALFKSSGVIGSPFGCL